jgi:hypothetical protein
MAVDPAVTNDDGVTAATLAAGYGHERCLRVLREYGGRVDARASVLVAARRRLSEERCTAMVQAEWRQTKDRLGRIVEVWERVLDAAIARGEQGHDSGTGAVAKPRRRSLTTGSSTMHASLLEAGPHKHVGVGAAASVAAAATTHRVTAGAGAGAGLGGWCRRYDAATGCDYFVSDTTGVTAWAATVQQPHLASRAASWQRLVDDHTGYPYFLDTATGSVEWEAVPDTGVRVEVEARSAAAYDDGRAWRLAWDDASGAPYFVQLATGVSRWCVTSEVLEKCCGEDMVFQECVDDGTGATYFLHAGTGVSAWAV